MQQHCMGIHTYEGIDESWYAPYLDTFGFIGISRMDAIRLLNRYLRIDVDRGGSIDSLEFLMFFDKFPDQIEAEP